MGRPARREWNGHKLGEGLIVKYGENKRQFAIFSHVAQDGRRPCVLKWSVNGQRWRGPRPIEPDRIIRWLGEIRPGQVESEV